MPILFDIFLIMAVKTIDRVEKKFYLYDSSNNLITKEKSIYSPFNIKVQDRFQKWIFKDPIKITFRNWIFVLKPEDWQPHQYDQILEFLSFYNPLWWKLTKWREGTFEEEVNWKKYWWDNIHIVKTELATDKRIVTKTITETVVKSVIPEFVLRTLDLEMLKVTAKEMEVTIPELTNWTPEEMKDLIIKNFIEAWRTTK